ncbi:hypothetical protein C8Q77DRAFT_279498 [Trametes polyzona]|nr:hypothetical protein C8Q77DRAFT_279498 [Trametes polyzona]
MTLSAGFCAPTLAPPYDQPIHSCVSLTEIPVCIRAPSEPAPGEDATHARYLRLALASVAAFWHDSGILGFGTATSFASPGVRRRCHTRHSFPFVQTVSLHTDEGRQAWHAGCSQSLCRISASVSSTLLGQGVGLRLTSQCQLVRTHRSKRPAWATPYVLLDAPDSDLSSYLKTSSRRSVTFVFERVETRYILSTNRTALRMLEPGLIPPAALVTCYHCH